MATAARAPALATVAGLPGDSWGAGNPRNTESRNSATTARARALAEVVGLLAAATTSAFAGAQAAPEARWSEAPPLQPEITVAITRPQAFAGAWKALLTPETKGPPL